MVVWPNPKPFGFFRFLKPNFVLLCECSSCKSLLQEGVAVSSLETSESEVQIYRLEFKLWTKTVPFTRWKIKLLPNSLHKIEWILHIGIDLIHITNHSYSRLLLDVVMAFRSASTFKVQAGSKTSHSRTC